MDTFLVGCSGQICWIGEYSINFSQLPCWDREPGTYHLCLTKEKRKGPEQLSHFPKATRLVTGGDGLTPGPAAVKADGKALGSMLKVTTNSLLSLLLKGAWVRPWISCECGQDNCWALGTFLVLVWLSPPPGPHGSTCRLGQWEERIPLSPTTHQRALDIRARWDSRARRRGHVGCSGQMLAPGHIGPPCWAPAHLAQLCRGFRN